MREILKKCGPRLYRRRPLAFDITGPTARDEKGLASGPHASKEDRPKLLAVDRDSDTLRQPGAPRGGRRLVLRRYGCFNAEYCIRRGSAVSLFATLFLTVTRNEESETAKFHASLRLHAEGKPHDKDFTEVVNVDRIN